MKKKLSEELEVMCHIILNAKASFDVVRYFNNENHNKFNLINRERISNYFFQFVEVNFFRTTIIELFKLYSPSTDDYYSLYSLKNRFNPGKKYESIEISEELFKDVNLILKQSKAEIEKLRDLRNKVYAHNDQEYKKYLGILTIEEISTLIKVAKDILEKIYSEILKAYYFFDSQTATPIDSLEHLFNKIEFFNTNYEEVMLKNIGIAKPDEL